VTSGDVRQWFARVLPIIAVAVGIPIGLRGQAPDQPLAFEAASIKPNASALPGRRIGVPGGRFAATNVTLKELIATAYGLPGLLPQALLNYQISGGPSWIESDRFDVEATAAGDVVRGTEGTRRKQLMLRTLLAQRFNLALHHETKQMPVYALVTARRDKKLGPKLRKSDVDCAPVLAARRTNNLPVLADDPCSSGVSITGLLKGGAMTMNDLSVWFSKLLDRAVLDRTGLSGAFSVEAQFTTEGLPGLPAPPPGFERLMSESPSIFVAIQDQLGLKLESTKGPVDVLVIDHVDKPTPD
jgi:uncharacterized protein (TIGR03435 family)